ncbi:MAG: hypothetical protein K1Y36_08055 [Blastocatellia bacterium]|nr:hypothetical protein [Blastocatellia bacterium]
MSRPKTPMSNPFAPDSTKAALRALTQPVLAQPDKEPETQKSENANTQKPQKAIQLATLGPRTIVLSDGDMLAAQEFGYLRGCRDLSAVFRAALECLLKAEEAGLIEVTFERKTGDRGGRPVYAHSVTMKQSKE